MILGPISCSQTIIVPTQISRKYFLNIALELRAQKLASQYLQYLFIEPGTNSQLPMWMSITNYRTAGKTSSFMENITKFNALFRKYWRLPSSSGVRYGLGPDFTLCIIYLLTWSALGTCAARRLAHRYCLQCSFHAVLTPCLIFNFYNLRFLMHRTVGVDLNLVPVVMHFLWGVAETSSYAP